MNLPDKVKLGWRTYSISIARRQDPQKMLYGEIDFERNTIFINEDGSQGTQKSTLLHEIIHWIFYNSGHANWRNDEELVNSLAENLMMIFIENPELAGLLFCQDSQE
jgi:Zn-dependent peptidase ImmA (M78 family)